MKGRTTRLVLQAVIALSEGNDVTIVGFTAIESKAIASKVVRIARALGIPCRNVLEFRGTDAPRVSFRPFGMALPHGPMTKAKVFIDHRAQFERGSVMPPAERTVHA